MLAMRALGADAQDATLLEAAAFVVNGRMGGDADPTILGQLRKQKGLPESAIAQAFAFADQATINTVWVAQPPDTLELVMGTIENEARLGKDAHEVLVGLRARGIVAASLKQDSPFRSEALIAEAFRRLRLRVQPPVDDKSGGATPGKKSSKVMIAGLVITALAAGAAGVVYLRRRRRVSMMSAHDQVAYLEGLIAKEKAAIEGIQRVIETYPYQRKGLQPMIRKHRELVREFQTALRAERAK